MKYEGRSMKLMNVTRWMLLMLLALTLAGCASAMVGNSPEEIKHRQKLGEP